MNTSSAQKTILVTIGGTVAIVYVARLAAAPSDALNKPGEMLRIGFGGAVAAIGLMVVAEGAPEIATALSWLVLMGGTMSYGAPAAKAISKVVTNQALVLKPVANSMNIANLSYTDGPPPGASEYGDATGLDPQFNDRLQAFMKAAPKMVSITSGFRSVAEQQTLWDNALAKYGSADAARQWVAPPGSSNHNKGLAADLAFADQETLDWAHAHAADYGLNFPLSNENWHIEPVGIR